MHADTGRRQRGAASGSGGTDAKSRRRFLRGRTANRKCFGQNWTGGLLHPPRLPFAYVPVPLTKHSHILAPCLRGCVGAYGVSLSRVPHRRVLLEAAEPRRVGFSASRRLVGPSRTIPVSRAAHASSHARGHYGVILFAASMGFSGRRSSLSGARRPLPHTPQMQPLPA